MKDTEFPYVTKRDGDGYLAETYDTGVSSAFSRISTDHYLQSNSTLFFRYVYIDHKPNSEALGQLFVPKWKWDISLSEYMANKLAGKPNTPSKNKCVKLKISEIIGYILDNSEGTPLHEYGNVDSAYNDLQRKSDATHFTD